MQFARFYPVIHRILKPSFPNCLWSGSSQTPKIALTFDDGPHPEYTPQLLKVLERYNIPCSFFWLGVCVDNAPEVAKAVYQQGHWLGLHGYTHRSFPRMRTMELQQSLQKTQQAIERACELPGDKICDVRPPNGFFTPQILKQLRQWEYRPVMWSVVPEDWVRPGARVVTQRVLQQVTNGSLIVLHDGMCGGQDVAETANLLIPRLLDAGYEFVSVNEL